MATLRVIDILFASDMHEAQIAAGWRGLRNPVNSYTVAGEPDVGDWLHGGEAVFSTAFFVKNDIAATVKWVESLVHKKAACLGLKAGRFIGEIPFEVLELCNRHDLPLLLLPDQTTWATLFKSLFRLEELGQSPSLTHLASLSNHWLDLLHQETHQKLDRVLEDFYTATGRPIFLMSSEGIVLAQSPRDSDTVIDSWAHHLRKIHHREAHHLELPDEGIACRVLPESSNLWLVFPPGNTVEDSSLRHLLMAMIGGFLPDGWPIAQQSHLLSSLICGDDTSHADTIALSKWRLNQPGYVVVAPIAPNHFSFRRIQDLLRPHLEQTIGWYFINGQRLVLGISSPLLSHRKLLHRDAADQLYQSLSSAHLAEVLSIGPLSRTLEQYRLSYRLAGIIAESPWAKNMRRPAKFTETAMFLDLATGTSEAPLQKYLKAFIRPFFEEPNRALLSTLKTLLDNKLSVTATAQQLFLHPNTVKYRIAKIEDLLDFDLSTPASLATLIWILGLLDLEIITPD